MNNQMIPLSDVERMATAVAKSGLFGVKSPDQAMALMLVAQAEGLHPALAARDYHVIQGRPALKSDAMLARFQQAGGKVRWEKYTNDVVSGEFSHPAGGTVMIEWTIAMAKSAGLAGKDIWRQYPRQMLRARVISEGIRTVFPGVLVGSYTPEEIQDMEEPAARRPKRPITVEAETLPALPPSQELPEPPAFSLDAAVAAIGAAESMDVLKSVYSDAYAAADALGDDAAIDALVRAKDARKAALTPAPSKLKAKLAKSEPAPAVAPEQLDDVPFEDDGGAL